MKTFFQAPKLVVVELTDADIVCTSPIYAMDKAADNSDQLGKERTHPIWDD